VKLPAVRALTAGWLGELDTMRTPPAIKPPAPQAPSRNWSSSRFSAAVEAAYLLEVASR